MKVIGFGHRKQVGKDTTARCLANLLADRGKVVSVQSFANRLKYVCKTIYPTFFKDLPFYEENPQHKNDKIDVLNKTVRDVWIEIANKLREFDANIWIRSLFQSIQQHKPASDFLIIPDVRYPNEVLFIKELGGIVIKVENPRVKPTNDVADCALDNYEGWNCRILNNGTFSDLQVTCENLIHELGAFFK